MNFGRLSVRRGEHSAVGCEAHEAAKVIHVEPNETHSIPPWWVVAGVKPEGPETDYGAYRTAGFSKSQQEQPLDQMKGLKSLVQVRSRRDRACAASWAALDRGPYPRARTTRNWHRFTAATRSLQPCIDPPPGVLQLRSLPCKEAPADGPESAGACTLGS